MRLSSLSDYAVVLMSAAVRLDAGGTRLTATMLADDTGVPLPTAQKLMGRLAAAGLFRSGRGTGGGFTLARDAAAISLADIVEAVEGPIALTACVDGGGKGPCQIHDDCRVRPQMDAVNGAVRGALAGVTLQMLATSSVRPELVEGLSFSTTAGKKGRASTGSAQTVVGA